VLPGKYKVKMTYGEQSDSTTVQVHFDPRIEYNMADLRAKRDMQHELMDLTETTTEATNQLHDAMGMIETAEKLLKSDKAESNEEQLKELRERTEAVKDSVNALFDFVLGKEDDRQGITRSPEPSVTTRLQAPSQYLGSSIGAPTSTERTLMEHARESVNKALEKINGFFEDEWPAYVEEMENAELSPFKQFENVELN
jgi:ElaB/YqjD/DUF883 family membrane-anchored ribosome-binding protein